MRTMSRPAVALRGACAMFVLGGFAETALADPTESVAPPARGPSMAVPAGCREIELNGPRLSGTALDKQGGACGIFGAELQPVPMNKGVTLARGGVRRDLRLVGTTFHGASGPLSRDELIGATLVGSTVSLGDARLRIATVEEEKGPGGAPVLLYRLTYQWDDGKQAAAGLPRVTQAPLPL